MKKQLLICLLIVSINLSAQNILTKFERSGGNESPVYTEIIEWWKNWMKDQVK